MTKQKDIIHHLPDLYRGEDESLLSVVLGALGTQLQQVEADLFEIMKAHWVDQAGELVDLARLGAIFDIQRREGEDLETYRLRLKDTVAAYLAGVGTVQVVREITAACLGLPEEEQDRIKIIENPLHWAQSEPQVVAYGSEWPVTVIGFIDASEEVFPLKVLITGVGEKTSNPTLLNLTTGLLVGFWGTVPGDKDLVIDPDLTARLDGKDVSSQVHARAGTQFGRAIFGNARFFGSTTDALVLPRGTSVWRCLPSPARFAPEGGGVGGTVVDGPVARVQFQWRERQMAAFVVQLPWSIVRDPAETDRRRLVKEEVDKVRAAGVQATVEYLSSLSGELVETQTQQTRLCLLKSRLVLREAQRQTEQVSLASRKTQVEQQVTADHLTFNGVFNRTYFGSSRFD